MSSPTVLSPEAQLPAQIFAPGFGSSSKTRVCTAHINTCLSETPRACQAPGLRRWPQKASDDSVGQHQLAYSPVPLLKSILPTSLLALDFCEKSAVGLFIGVSKFEQSFPSLPVSAQRGPLSAPWKERHIWAGLQSGAAAFIATDSCICFWAGHIYSYIKMQRAPRVEGPHLYESFLVAPSLEGSATDTLDGWGRWEEILWAADNQLSHWAQRIAFFWDKAKQRESFTPFTSGCNTLIYWYITAT